MGVFGIFILLLILGGVFCFFVFVCRLFLGFFCLLVFFLVCFFYLVFFCWFVCGCFLVGFFLIYNFILGISQNNLLVRYS